MKEPIRDGIAAAAPLVGVVAVWVFSYHAPFGLPVLPIVVAGYFGGGRGGAIATAITLVAALAMGIAPQHVAALVAAGLLIAGAGELLHRWRRRAERSEHLYNESFRASPTPLALHDLATGRVVDANQAYARLTGWTRDELIGLTADELGLASPDERERVRSHLFRERAVRDVPVEVGRKSGEPRQCLLSAVIVVVDGLEHSMTTVIDVTDHRRAESNARDFEQRFRELANTIDEVFWINDLHMGHIFYISPAYERVWGRTCAELYESPRAWIDAVHPDDREHVITNGTAPELEYRIIRPDGTVRWIHNRAFEVRDEHGHAVRMAGVATDVTARRKMEEELQQAQKMESLGQLAGGIAHDFNNILAVIVANMSMLAEPVLGIGEQHELIEEINQAVGRATGLTRQLLAFSRKQRVEPVVLDVNAVVGETRKMLRRMIGEDIGLETSLEPELARVRMDGGHLVQVLMNLAVNARDAMPRGGTLRIETRNVAGPIPEVILAVEDNGSGMTPEVRARIFEPFFTTKGVTKGTGLGLAVVHGIVVQAGGRVEVETVPGKGTTFLVHLPAIDTAPDARIDPARLLAGGAETVLVVDDDVHVRHATSRALRKRGYRAIEAPDARAALLVLEREAIDLLVTDVVMPGMNGRELAEAARMSRPEIKVLYTSGYTDDELLSRGGMNHEVELLEKPFRNDALAAKVRAVLDHA